jgi:hypothetical protein
MLPGTASGTKKNETKLKYFDEVEEKPPWM